MTATLAVAALMAIWWVSETIPLAVTALVPMVLFPALGVLDGKAVSEVYMNHIIFVYVGGFMMALAMEKWNLHKRIALKLLVLIGVSPGTDPAGFYGHLGLPFHVDLQYGHHHDDDPHRHVHRGEPGGEPVGKIHHQVCHRTVPGHCLQCIHRRDVHPGGIPHQPGLSEDPDPALSRGP